MSYPTPKSSFCTPLPLPIFKWYFICFYIFPFFILYPFLSSFLSIVAHERSVWRNYPLFQNTYLLPLKNVIDPFKTKHPIYEKNHPKNYFYYFPRLSLVFLLEVDRDEFSLLFGLVNLLKVNLCLNYHANLMRWLLNFGHEIFFFFLNFWKYFLTKNKFVAKEASFSIRKFTFNYLKKMFFHFFFLYYSKVYFLKFSFNLFWLGTSLRVYRLSLTNVLVSF